MSELGEVWFLTLWIDRTPQQIYNTGCPKKECRDFRIGAAGKIVLDKKNLYIKISKVITNVTTIDGEEFNYDLMSVDQQKNLTWNQLRYNTRFLFSTFL